MFTKKIKAAVVAVFTTSFCAGMVFAGDWQYDLTADGSGILIKGYTGNAKDIVIPATIEDYPVKEIGDGVFSNRYTMASVNIPNSVTKIGNSAFANNYLSSVKLPASLTEIGNSAFYSSEKLTNIEIPNSVTKIGERAFFYCRELQNVRLSASLTGIEESTFSECYKLKTIQISNSVTKIGEKAFEGCSALTNITIPDSITEIGKFAFCDCKNLSTVKFPKGQVTIGYGAFRNTAITSLTITGNIIFATNNENESSTLFSSAKLTTLVVEADVVSLPSADHNSYFIDAQNLTNITFKSPDTIIGEHTIKIFDTMPLKTRAVVKTQLEKTQERMNVCVATLLASIGDKEYTTESILRLFEQSGFPEFFTREAIAKLKQLKYLQEKNEMCSLTNEGKAFLKQFQENQ